jgi:hypothetical protein
MLYRRHYPCELLLVLKGTNHFLQIDSPAHAYLSFAKNGGGASYSSFYKRDLSEHLSKLSFDRHVRSPVERIGAF